MDNAAGRHALDDTRVGAVPLVGTVPLSAFYWPALRRWRPSIARLRLLRRPSAV